MIRTRYKVFTIVFVITLSFLLSSNFKKIVFAYNKWLGGYEAKIFYQKLMENVWLIVVVIVGILLLLLWNLTLRIRVAERTKELLEANNALNESKEELLALNEETEASFNELAAIEEELRSQYEKLMEVKTI